MHCGMEVVLPNGELIRTGMGAMPNPGASSAGGTVDEQPGNRCWQVSPSVLRHSVKKTNSI